MAQPGITQSLKDKLSSITAPDGQPGELDVAFAAMIHHHHEQGLVMARLAAERAATDGVRAKAGQMAAAQADELEEIAQLLTSLGAQPASSPQQVESFNEALLERMRQESGEALDRMFLQTMALHHVDAVHQAELFLKAGEDPRLRQLADHSRGEQLEDLEDMERLLAGLTT